MARVVCVVNPTAGSGRAGTRWADMAARLQAAGIEAEACFTTCAGEGTSLTRRALENGATTVVAVGGDGTIHEVMNGFFNDTTPLNPAARMGILPAGSGSDLIKSLEIPKDPARAVAVLASGKAAPIDLGRVTYTSHAGALETRWFINIASAGLSGDTVKRMAELPSFLRGALRYKVAAVCSILFFKPPEIFVAFDDQPADSARLLLVVVANGRYFGAGMKVAPDARVDDGELDLVAIKARPLPELLLNFPRIFAGTHLELPGVDHGRGKRVALMGDTPMLLEIDGEQPGRTPATFEIVPRALQVIRP